MLADVLFYMKEKEIWRQPNHQPQFTCNNKGNSDQWIFLK